jgi:uncharacterized protein (TIGR02391 family)
VLFSNEDEDRLYEEDGKLYLTKKIADKISSREDEFKAIWGDAILTRVFNLVDYAVNNNIIGKETKEKMDLNKDQLVDKIKAIYNWAKQEGLEIANTFDCVPAIFLVQNEEPETEKQNQLIKQYNEWLGHNNLLNKLDEIAFDKLWILFCGASGVVSSLRAREDYIQWDIINGKVRLVSESKYNNKHYADAAESAIKEVNTQIKSFFKSQTGRELDGCDLMEAALSFNWDKRRSTVTSQPVVRIGDLTNDSGRNMQKGYRNMLKGAMQAIRNTRAHANLDDHPEEAAHLIYISSQLMNKFDSKL